MANPAFGGGLALDYKIPRDQFAMAERAMKQRSDFDKAKAKTKQLDDKAAMDWGKIAKVDYSKIHALDNARATEIGGQIGKIIEEERNSGNPNWQNGLMLKLQPIVQQVGELNVRKQQFDKMTQQMASDEAAGNTYPEAIDYRKKIEAGDVAGVKDFKDRYGNISTTVNNEGLVVPSASRLTKEDIDAEVKKEMNTDYNRSFLGRVMEAQIDPAVKQYLIQNGLPKNKKDAQDIANSIGWTGQLPTTLEDIVKNKQTNLGSRRGFIRQMGDVLEKDYPEFFDDKTTQDRKEEILTEAGLKRYANLSGIKSIEKSVRREKPPAPQRPTEAERNPVYDVTVNYNADVSGNEQFSPSYKGTPEPKGFVVRDAKGNKTVVFGVADRVSKRKGENDFEIVIKDKTGNTVTTSASPENLTQLRAQWGVSPFGVRNQANKKAGHKNYTETHPSTTGVTYGNLYKENPKSAEGVTTPPKDARGTSKARTVTSRKYSPSRDKTKITYSDGTEEIVDGKQ
jgi:hypothetical protein